LTTVWQAPGSPAPAIDVQTVPDFVAKAPQGPGSRPIFAERLLDAQVTVHRDLAQAWVRYEAEFGDSATMARWRGYDAITLLKNQGRWRITSLAFTDADGPVTDRQSKASTTITNVMIVDGTGGPSRRGAVRLVNDTIAAVGEVKPAPGDSVIDGRGLVLAPGFVDTHSHHDWGLSRTPDATAAVSQGITTIIAGQDGGHPMPVAAAMDSLAQSAPAVNVGFYAGHGTLRAAVMGRDFKRPATRREVDSMTTLLRQELAAGALGLSTGLEYDPGINSDRAEIMTLAKATAALGGRYISHIRSEDRWFWEAIDEIIAIGRETGMPVQISHLKLAMVTLWGKTDSLIRLLERARASGVDITADVYPYPYWQSTLTVLFPNRDFDNRAEAEKILREIAKPEGLLIGDFAANPSYAGKTVAEIAKLRNEDAATTLMALIRESLALGAKGHPESGAVESVVATSMTEVDVAKLLAWEHSNVCSDGALAGAHPRGFGAFPRVLGRLVREQRAFSLETAVRKMTGLAASHVGLIRRGVIAPGNFADLVLFDPATVNDRATPKDPHLLSSGIELVWVNGQLVWRTGRSTGKRPGRVLRRGVA
jgi:N-acyl-D-amino-acid deacylase